MSHMEQVFYWFLSQQFVAFLFFIPFSIIVVIGGLIITVRRDYK